jgi:hypothetical protein
MEASDTWRSLSPWKARALLAGLLILMAVAGYFGRAPVITGSVSRGHFSDLDMHRLAAAGVHRGESYYDALGPVLRRWGYAPKPFFAWRLPTLAWSIGKLPRPEIAKVLLMALAVAMMLAWARRLRPQLGFPLTCVALLLLIPSLVLASLPHWYFQHELWAGLLIALSLALYPRHWAAAVVCGLAALMIRELTLAYVVIMCVWAAYERRTREMLAWLAGIVAFVAYLAMHARIVTAHQMPTDLSDPSWLRLAGWPFVVACSSWMFWALIPYWLGGALSVFGVFGLLASRNGRLLTSGLAYMAAFCIVGKPFNDYWGLMYTPLLAVGLAFALPAAVGLLQRAMAGPMPLAATESPAGPRQFVVRQQDLKEQE